MYRNPVRFDALQNSLKDDKINHKGNRVAGWLASILHRMGVVLMDKKDKNFDFKDLMAFGMFLLALLTFVYMICH